jgi:hypothetical protein
VTLDRRDVFTLEGSHESAERISSFALTNSFRGIWRDDDIPRDQQAERPASQAHLTAITMTATKQDDGMPSSSSPPHAADIANWLQ